MGKLNSPNTTRMKHLRTTFIIAAIVVVLLLLVGLSIRAFQLVGKDIRAVKADIRAVKADIGEVKAEIRAVKADIGEVKAEIRAVKADIGEVKTEIDATRDFIPPLYGGRHIEVRQFAIWSQARQLKQGFVMITGDSITEGLGMNKILGAPVLNGGMGGATLSSVSALLNGFPTEISFETVVIAVGVNDAVRRAHSSAFYDSWEKLYRAVVSKAKSKSSRVAVSTIIPVESGETLGDQYFDPDMIAGLNTRIRKVATEMGISLIDNDPAFQRLASQKQTYTIDGVHLNGLGYDTWQANIRTLTKKK